jgi:hypothetical protein
MSVENLNSKSFVVRSVVSAREFSSEAATAADKTRRVLAQKMGPPGIAPKFIATDRETSRLGCEFCRNQRFAASEFVRASGGERVAGRWPGR